MGVSTATDPAEAGSELATAGKSPTPPPPPRKASRVNPEREAEILTLWRAGRKDPAMSLLMDTYGKGLLGHARRMLGDEDAAQDVRQQTFLEVWRGMDAFEGRSSLWTWVYAIAHNRCLDQRKRQKRIQAREVPVDDAVSNVVLRTPDQSMLREQLTQREALEQCLAQLPEPLRQQVLMRCCEGMSYAEIGAIVGEAPGTIQVRIARALPKLRRCLGPDL